jgi:Transposase DDE domain group 1
MRGRRRNRAQRRPRIPPFAPITPVAQHRRGDTKLAGDLQQRPTAARQQGDCFSLKLIGELPPSLAHSTPFRSRRSLAKVSTNSGQPQFRLLIHTAAYWLLLSLRGLAPWNSFWRDAQFDTIRLCLIKVAGRVTELVTRIQDRPADRLSLPDRLRHAGRSYRYAAAVTDGDGCPRTNPLAPTSNPDASVPRRHGKPRPRQCHHAVGQHPAE